MQNDRRSFWLQCVALLLVFFFSTTTTTSAQTAQASDRKLNLSLAADAASLAQPGRRQSDSLLNGALIGAGVAVATGLFICTRMEPWEVCRDDFGPMVKLGVVGAGIGMAIDALVRRSSPSINTPVSHVQATPIVGRRAGGLHFSVSF